MKVAVIGAGSMGGMHSQLLGGMPDVEVLVVDADASRAAAVASNSGGRAVTEAQAFDEADAVVIATPAFLHAAQVEAAVARGLPVLCEKPLTDDLPSSLALVELVERAGAHVQVGFQRRHDPGFVAARAAVLDAGRVHLLRLTAFDPRVVDRTAESWGAGETAPIFLHSSVHDFDFVRWMSGSEVTEVSVDGSRRDGSRPDDVDRKRTRLNSSHLVISCAVFCLEAKIQLQLRRRDT